MIRIGKLAMLLSESEKAAIIALAEQLNEETSALLVTSKVAAKLKLSRSIFVNAQTKLEIAEIIESKSLGMKGTRINVLNPNAFKQLVEIIK